MSGQCCRGGRPASRLARRLSGAAASVLPGAALVLLPKCPLCLAAWLTVVTGWAVSAAAAWSVYGAIAVLWVGGLAFTLLRIIGRRTLADRCEDRARPAGRTRGGLGTGWRAGQTPDLRGSA